MCAHKKIAILPLITVLICCLNHITVYSQCATPITTFPYTEGFESSNGGWFAGGAGSDWIWGTPSKPVIQTAGGGTKCWVVGGLTGSAYTNSEASWLQSPCFDLSSLDNPYISLKVFWETEQQFDGASLQYSIDNGINWITLGNANDNTNCLNTNWYNQTSINYLSPLTTARQGWSGNVQSSSGSCRGGNGSGRWLTATHIMPMLAGEPTVLFRFIFGAGTICNAYDGFAIDDIFIGEAPSTTADFSYTCNVNKTVNFINTSTPCPTTFTWDFGDPASGTNNTSNNTNTSHVFTASGVYDVTLTAVGSGSATGTITKQVTILGVLASVVNAADCETNTGGSAMAIASGTTDPISFNWNTNPPQTTSTATGLASGSYIVTVQSGVACAASATATVPLDNSCTGVYFPTAFTPNNDGLNDGFGAIGGLGSISTYRLSIYNRWGELVYQTTNPFAKWDGTIRGKKPDSGLFVWQAELVIQGNREKRKGTIMLIR